MLKIKAIERQTPIKKGEPKKKLWYPAIHLAGDVRFDELIELIADETTVSSADIKAVFDRTGKVLERLLKDGKSVDCGDLGTFRPSITAKSGAGVDKADRISVDMVGQTKVIYTPRVRIKNALKGVRIERADKALDVAFGSKAKPKPGGGSTPNPGGGGSAGV